MHVFASDAHDMTQESIVNLLRSTKDLIHQSLFSASSGGHHDDIPDASNEKEWILCSFKTHMKEWQGRCHIASGRLECSSNTFSSIDSVTHIKFLQDFEEPPMWLGGELLQSLVELDFGGKIDKFCRIMALPEQIGTISNLRSLSLEGCANLTELPTSIWNLTALTMLNLGGCEDLIELPEAMGNLIGLETLVASGTGIKLLPSAFSSLTSLQHVDLGGCMQMCNFPRVLGQLSNLQTLILGGFDCTEQLPECFGRLPKLTHLDISALGVLDFPPCIELLTTLTNLDLRGCEQIQNVPSWISKLSLLETFDIGFCTNIDLIPDTLGQLSNLKFINLAGCEKLRTIPSTFCNLTGLTTLNLDWCVSLKNIRGITQSLRNLHMLSLAGLKSEELIAWLEDSANFQMLASLSLEGNDLESIPESLLNLVSLTNLNLGGSKRLLVLPSWLGKMTHISKLNLSRCRLANPPQAVIDGGTWAVLEYLRSMDSNCIKQTQINLSRPENDVSSFSPPKGGNVSISRVNSIAVNDPKPAGKLKSFVTSLRTIANGPVPSRASSQKESLAETPLHLNRATILDKRQLPAKISLTGSEKTAQPEIDHYFGEQDTEKGLHSNTSPKPIAVLMPSTSQLISLSAPRPSIEKLAQCADRPSTSALKLATSDLPARNWAVTRGRNAALPSAVRGDPLPEQEETCAPGARIQPALPPLSANSPPIGIQGATSDSKGNNSPPGRKLQALPRSHPSQESETQPPSIVLAAKVPVSIAESLKRPRARSEERKCVVKVEVRPPPLTDIYEPVENGRMELQSLRRTGSSNTSPKASSPIAGTAGFDRDAIPSCDLGPPKVPKGANFLASRRSEKILEPGRRLGLRRASCTGLERGQNVQVEFGATRRSRPLSPHWLDHVLVGTDGTDAVCDA